MFEPATITAQWSVAAPASVAARANESKANESIVWCWLEEVDGRVWERGTYCQTF